MVKKRRLPLWQLSLFCWLLLASLCASATAGSPISHAQTQTRPHARMITSQSYGNNPVFTDVTDAASLMPLKNQPLGMRTFQATSRSTLRPAVTTPETCTTATVTGTSTTSGAVAFTEYPLTTAPYTITKGGDGAYWFIENAANKIGRLTTAGGLTECPVPTAAANLQGISNGPTTSIWFTEASGNNIGNITISGTTATFNEYALTTPSAFPVNITLGPDGNMWFTEQGVDQIGTITTGATPTVTEYAGLITGSGPLGIVSTGTGGNLWFTEPFIDQIGMITTAGGVTEYTGLIAGSNPFGITVGPTVAGAVTMWFTEPGTNKIADFPIPATGTTITVTETAIPTTVSNPNFITSFSGTTSSLAFNEEYGNKEGLDNTSTGGLTEYVIPTPNAHPIGLVNGGLSTVWFTEFGTNKIAMMKYRLGNGP